MMGKKKNRKILVWVLTAVLLAGSFSVSGLYGFAENATEETTQEKKTKDDASQQEEKQQEQTQATTTATEAPQEERKTESQEPQTQAAKDTTTQQQVEKQETTSKTDTTVKQTETAATTEGTQASTTEKEQKAVQPTDYSGNATVTGFSVYDASGRSVSSSNPFQNGKNYKVAVRFRVSAGKKFNKGDSFSISPILRVNNRAVASMDCGTGGEVSVTGAGGENIGSVSGSGASLRVALNKNAEDASTISGTIQTGAGYAPEIGEQVSGTQDASVSVGGASKVMYFEGDAPKTEAATKQEVQKKSENVQTTAAQDDSAQYHVRYYKETDVENHIFVLEDTETKTADVGEKVSAEQRNYSGYQEDTDNADEKETGIVAADGSLVLKVFYEKVETKDTSSDTSKYLVKHFKEKANGNGYELAQTETLTGKRNSRVSARPKHFTGYQEDTNCAGRKASGIISDSETQLVLVLYYERCSTTYNVEHYKEVSKGIYKLADTDVLYGDVGATVTAVAKQYEGYAENTKHPNRMAAGMIQSGNSLTLRLYYDKTSVNYQVEHYRKNLDNGAYELADREINQGYAGTVVTAQPKNYAGYTENTTYPGRVSSAAIRSDGTTVLKLYYDPSAAAYTVEHYKENADGTYLLSDTEEKTGIYGQIVTAIPKNYAGYQENIYYPSRMASGKITGDKTLVLRLYYSRCKTRYRVEHYKENTDGTVQLADAEMLTGTVGETVTAAPKEYQGYMEDTQYAGRVSSGTIPETGILVLKLYYRTSTACFTVEHYKQKGASNQYALAEKEQFSGAIGQFVTAIPKQYAGYVENTSHAGRIATGTIQADGSLVLRLYYDSRNDTAYKVEHYLQNRNNTYVLRETQQFSGTTGTVAYAQAKQYEGYTENTTYALRVASGIISDDGSLVLRLFYDKNANTAYKIEHYKQNPDGSGYQLADVDYGRGATGELVKAYPKQYEGYVENTGYPDRLAFGFIKGDGSLVLRLYYDLNVNAKYKVEHYKQNTSDDGYTLADVDFLSGKAGSMAVAAPKTYAGYTENISYPDRISTGLIAADGSLVLKLYYDRTKCAKYKVEHYKEMTDGTYTIADTQVMTAPTGSTVTAKPKDYPGYTEYKEHAERIDSGIVLADGSLVLKLFYRKNADTAYKVEHYKQKADRSGYELSDTEYFKGKAGTWVKAQPKQYESYVENTTYVDRIDAGFIKEDGSFVMRLYYDCAPNMAAYKVEHYKQNSVNKEQYDLADTEQENGTVGSAVTAVPKQYAGYTENTSHADRVSTGTVVSDGSLVLRLYYDLNTDGSYKVEHYLQNEDGNGYTLYETDDMTGMIGSQVEAVAKNYEGFVENKTWSQRIAAGVINQEGTLVLKLYYDRCTDEEYVVEHYQKPWGGHHYILVDSEVHTGMVGIWVIAISKTYVGYYENVSYSRTSMAGMIRSNGRLTLRLYYDQYEVTDEMDATTTKTTSSTRGYIATRSTSGTRNYYSSGGTTSGRQGYGGTTTGKVLATGDDDQLNLICFLMIAAGAGILVTVRKDKKKRRTIHTD